MLILRTWFEREQSFAKPLAISLLALPPRETSLGR